MRWDRKQDTMIGANERQPHQRSSRDQVIREQRRREKQMADYHASKKRLLEEGWIEVHDLLPYLRELGVELKARTYKHVEPKPVRYARREDIETARTLRDIVEARRRRGGRAQPELFQDFNQLEYRENARRLHASLTGKT